MGFVPEFRKDDNTAQKLREFVDEKRRYKI